MSLPDRKPPLVVILGPTAVGKTAVAIQLAKRLNGEIVSADSRLFYRGMDIGTAKPSPEERRQVPHHLIDVADAGETWNLTIFQQAAAQAIQDIHARGRLPFLVGGTGQYIHAVIHGWQPPAAGPDPHLRAELEELAHQHGAEWLHDELNRLDPQAAQRIDPRNLRRTIRALEVIRLTGRKFSAQRGQLESPYRLMKIGLTLPRQDLYARVDARIDAMFAAGLLQEVQQLLDAGVSPLAPAMTSIGYRECVAVLQGAMSPEQAVVQMRRNTRRFIRRQANWFKMDEPTIQWFKADLVSSAVLETTIQHFLSQEGTHEHT
jgi:tRNA dimethylallyltransferase